MPSLKTSEIIAEGVDSPRKLKKLSLRFGLEDSTVRDWRTGRKHNPLDQAARYIRFIHRYSPGNARLAAQHFVELVDELDAADGAELAHTEDGVCLSLAREVARSAEVIQHLVEAAPDGYDEDELRTALLKIASNRSSLDALEGCIGELLRKMKDAQLETSGGAQ